MKYMPILVVFMLSSTLFLSGCAMDTPAGIPTGEVVRSDCPECDTCPEQKAKIFVEQLDEGWNEYNTDELIFSFRAINSGDVEAKNVEVTCAIQDIRENTLYKNTENIGNIGSNSATITEIYVDTPSSFDFDEDELGYFICYATSCDNCDFVSDTIPAYRAQKATL